MVLKCPSSYNSPSLNIQLPHIWKSLTIPFVRKVQEETKQLTKQDQLGSKLHSEKWEIGLSHSLHHRKELHTSVLFKLKMWSLQAIG
jgi:hypothetical protein